MNEQYIDYLQCLIDSERITEEEAHDLIMRPNLSRRAIVAVGLFGFAPLKRFLDWLASLIEPTY